MVSPHPPREKERTKIYTSSRSISNYITLVNGLPPPPRENERTKIYTSSRSISNNTLLENVRNRDSCELGEEVTCNGI